MYECMYVYCFFNENSLSLTGGTLDQVAVTDMQSLSLSLCICIYVSIYLCVCHSGGTLDRAAVTDMLNSVHTTTDGNFALLMAVDEVE